MKPVIRQLNAEEKDYYEKSLYPLQDEVLDLFTEERFYLTGGTCLSRFYFKHRYSEDLDFFFEGTLYSVNQFEIDYLKLVSKIKASDEIEITVAGEHFKRLFIKKKDVTLKIEFIYEPYPRIDKVRKLKPKKFIKSRLWRDCRRPIRSDLPAQSHLVRQAGLILVK